MTLERWTVPTSDDETVEVFFEEVGEILEHVEVNMPAWRRDPEDKTALSEIRRGFHTLKGSGRMVKALDLADVAWKVENMLNQAIAGAVHASGSMVGVVDSVRAQIPRMVEAMKNGRSIAKNSNIVSLMKLADALAAGRVQTSLPVSNAATATAVAGNPRLRPSELNLRLERFTQRADEALHRSEMALQLARRTSAQIAALHKMVVRLDSRGDVQRISERLEELSKGVSGTPPGPATGPTDSILHESDMQRLVEQRVRARLAPAELLRTELQRDIEANTRTVNTLRRFAWLALGLSALVGALTATGLVILIPSLG